MEEQEKPGRRVGAVIWDDLTYIFVFSRCMVVNMCGISCASAPLTPLPGCVTVICGQALLALVIEQHIF